jgi:hypothetical protein
VDRLDRLAAYLDEAAAEPWSWPNSNCLTFLGRWVQRERPDYDFSGWIGACRDWPDARRIARRAGGTDALVERQARAAGLSRVEPDEACPGDIGLVRIRRDPVKPGHLTLGCILSPNRRWVVRTNTGAVFLDRERHLVSPHLAWEV